MIFFILFEAKRTVAWLCCLVPSSWPVFAALTSLVFIFVIVQYEGEILFFWNSHVGSLTFLFWDIIIIIIIILLLLFWHYSPWWTVTSSKTVFHCSRSCYLRLQFLTPIFCRSPSVDWSHLNLGSREWFCPYGIIGSLDVSEQMKLADSTLWGLLQKFLTSCSANQPIFHSCITWIRFWSGPLLCRLSNV